MPFVQIDGMEIIKILVVDDEPGICSGIRRVLHNFEVSFPFIEEEIRFEVTEVYNGEKALETIESTPPDVVLLDNKLPGIQGIDILTQVNKNHPGILVIMITSYASLDLAVKATITGAFDFLPKPFTPQEIKVAIESAAKHLYLKRMTLKMNKEGKQIRYQFLSVLSHELKSPINVIEGYLKMMQEKQMGSDLGKYAEMIDRSLARLQGMRSLIMDMLDLTRIESDKKNRTIEEVNLVELAKEAIDINEPYAIQRDVLIELESPAQIRFKADPDELSIIFNNLVSNAVKYNIDKGKVNLKLYDSATEIWIIVSDTGIGMSEEEIPRLFQDFVRIKNEKTRHISGSGLGLSIVKKLVDKYNGTIEVQSIPGKGTDFTVTFQK